MTSSLAAPSGVAPMLTQLGKGVVCGDGQPLVLIAGPCVIESVAVAEHVAGTMKETKIWVLLTSKNRAELTGTDDADDVAAPATMEMESLAEDRGNPLITACTSVPPTAEPTTGAAEIT